MSGPASAVGAMLPVDTLTVRVAVAVSPSPSVTVRAMV